MKSCYQQPQYESFRVQWSDCDMGWFCAGAGKVGFMSRDPYFTAWVPVTERLLPRNNRLLTTMKCLKLSYDEEWN